MTEHPEAIPSHKYPLNAICAVLWYYAASNGNSLPTFLDNVSVSSSRVQLVFPKRRYRITTRRRVITQKSADLIKMAAEA
jgi:hypothetical protein